MSPAPERSRSEHGTNAFVPPLDVEPGLIWRPLFIV